MALAGAAQQEALAANIPTNGEPGLNESNASEVSGGTETAPAEGQEGPSGDNEDDRAK